MDTGCDLEDNYGDDLCIGAGRYFVYMNHLPAMVLPTARPLSIPAHHRQKSWETILMMLGKVIETAW